jgi:hypothetical protein
VNLTGKSKNFKMLEFLLNQPQTFYRYLCDLCPLAAFIFSDLNYKMVIFLSQTESTPTLFLGWSDNLFFGNATTNAAMHRTWMADDYDAQMQ